MAESAVKLLLQTLDSLVRQEASLLRGFRTNINEIQLELQSMRSFLKDADRRKRSDDDDGVRTSVEQVREATYKVEDIIDLYMWQIAKHHTGKGLIPRALYNTLLLPKRYCYKRQIASELQAIQSEIQVISERRHRYGFHEEGQTSKMKNDDEGWQRSGEYLHFIPDEEIVGIDEYKDFLIRELTDERPERVVVAVVGMGGLGKTTLVTKVYDSPQVKNHFECHAWITVSRSYKVDDLMRNMIKELYESNKEAVPDGIDKMKGGHLVQTVIDYLQNKRYVIVLDDVWETIDWNHIRVAFPNNRCGSRIMLTTRIRDVALSFEAENILFLEPLGEDDAWLLFCNRAFLNKSCPPELEPYAKSLVQKCEGLPLAIVTIGGLMLTKEKSGLEWRKIENSLSWQLSNNKKMGGMKNILLLGFDDLPYNLKYCFLYCGLLPQDSQIQEAILISLWVAEVSSPPAHLKNLWLDGRLERLPPWIGSLQNLVYLVLQRSHLKEDPLSSLEALPNLISLRLIMMAYVGEELCFRHGCFLKLKARQRYGFNEEGQTSKMKNDVEHWQRSGEYLHFIPDEEIVGIDEDKDFLIGELTDERPERVVVAVVGMGGLGKTTLVTKVYDSPEVKNHFECHAWITTVINYLQNKRYVIVLDDVWETIDWNHIRVAFPNDRCGSRIMLTTRIHDVALSFQAENILFLEPLGEDDAWLLFCNRAFLNKSCPPELEPYAKSLVQKCEGLPLAIVTIGGLMLTKEKSGLEWKKIENSLSWQLSNNKKMGGMKNILLLGFDDLPYNLKYCFLYCGLFPEDSQIQGTILIRLWVAEGFIEEREGHTLEEVAEDYIKELTCRSMLQMKENDASPDRWVRMHDVLRELAISIGHEQNFCSTHDKKEAIWTNKARYLSMRNSIMNIQSSSTCHHRSLMLFQIEISSLSLCSISSTYKLLRVLVLSKSSIESVPDELVELFNLRLLDLSRTNVEELPKSIERLQNLQTLDIRETKIKILPKGVGKLKKLRHMLLSSGVQAPDGIFNLNCLQTLADIGINNDTVRKMGNLTQLRFLGIENVKRNHGKELSASLQKMKALLILIVSVISEEEILDLDAESSPPAHLKNLWLKGRLERLPPWIGSLQNLVHLALQRSHLKEDPLSSLEALPNLISLRLIMMAYVGEELCFRHGCFLKLKALAICEIPKLNLIKIENGSMTCIETLYLGECPELKRIPEGMRYLTTLQELFLVGMSEELIQRIKAGGERVNLLHIPFIRRHNSRNEFVENLQAAIGEEEENEKEDIYIFEPTMAING
ncbi:disease resistance protein RPM1-like protein [Cinnamomum micranthum f. kanehirae]|uniref:Disease resistance protein RPM1-like protein n=1 Tax=Cinnamomum micranthum f. kanehirae TaxID=337451 RepID=A0A3S3MCP4_9MAGN|nr:disease resistance protein RPM1-like protein [Cinnamomum micranthum f. kanehirae]